MIYLLDTNVISALMKLRGNVIERFEQIPSEDCSMSVITAHELYYGALRRADNKSFLKRIELLQFEILEYTNSDAWKAGKIRAELSLRGTPIGPLDTLIAAQALTRDLTLVTHNTREFARVPGLKLEDWEA